MEWNYDIIYDTQKKASMQLFYHLTQHFEQVDIIIIIILRFSKLEKSW